jgi:hypothetical protein
MKKLVLAAALALIAGSAFAHQGSVGASAAGGLAGSQSSAGSSAGGSVTGNGSSSDEASNNTYGYAGVATKTGAKGVTVSTSAGTGSENQVSGSKSGKASGSASGSAGSSAGAQALGGTIQFGAGFNW